MSGESEEKTFSWEEVNEHNNSESLWLVVHDVVYDLTKFMEEVRACYPALVITIHYLCSILEGKKCYWSKLVKLLMCGVLY